MKAQSKAITGSNRDQSLAALPTFMDHIQELKSRLFYVAVGFVVSAGVAYPFFQDIINLLVKPLGNHKLYYMSPAGGLSFILKVCMYAGFVGVLPVIVYQLYKFIAPVMPQHRSRAILGYTVASTVLALLGIAFAYFVSLPAALHFLTGIDLNNITAMLTIDAYMSFIMAYILAGALLFQLPLVMLIINSVTPLRPGALMSYQRHMIVASFVMAAIVSPTPDIVNQTLLAAPIVIMYQVGILIVWLRQRGSRRTQLQSQAVAATHTELAQSQPLRQVLQSPRQVVDVSAPVKQVTAPATSASFIPTNQVQTRAIRRNVAQVQRRSIDGLVLSSGAHTTRRTAHTPNATVSQKTVPHTHSMKPPSPQRLAAHRQASNIDMVQVSSARPAMPAIAQQSTAQVSRTVHAKRHRGGSVDGFFAPAHIMQRQPNVPLLAR